MMAENLWASHDKVSMAGLNKYYSPAEIDLLIEGHQPGEGLKVDRNLDKVVRLRRVRTEERPPEEYKPRKKTHRGHRRTAVQKG